MLEWPLISSIVGIAAGVSLLMLVATAITVPLLMIRLPEDYFQRKRPHLLQKLHHASKGRALLILGKNLIGIVLLVLGVLMLVLPGQGILTMLGGIILIDCPRKLEIERWLIKKSHMLKTINWLRRKNQKPPLSL